MPSKTIEQYLKTAPSQEKAALEKAAQQLKDSNVQLKPDTYGPQTPARRAERPNANEPKLDKTVFPNQQTQQQEQPQREAPSNQQKRDEVTTAEAPGQTPPRRESNSIGQAMAKAERSKTAEHGQTLQKQGVSKEQTPER